MVFNGQARSIIGSSVKPNLKFVAHDWWCYIIICGTGGVVVYDPDPKIYYRQHNNNVLGANSGFVAKLKRFSMLRLVILDNGMIKTFKISKRIVIYS